MIRQKLSRSAEAAGIGELPTNQTARSIGQRGAVAALAVLFACLAQAPAGAAASASSPLEPQRDLTKVTSASADQCPAAKANQKQLQRHVQTIKAHGKEPVRFAVEALQTVDLLVFDDGLHTAKEPFDYYSKLVADPEFAALAPTVFIEMFPANRQSAIDAYLSTEPENQELLYPAFQEEFGWPYQTYFDLMHAIYQANLALPIYRRIKVRAVSTPSVWQEIQSRADWETNANNVELSRDFFMFALISDGLDGFRSGKKGIFLTNTRHAYAALKQKDGTPFRTTAALIRSWHPGKSLSIRINAPILSVSGRRSAPGLPRTQSGEEQFDIRWTRIADGLWDEAFATAGRGPVAVSLANTPFGEASYRGNLMLAAAPGQTMRDGYDAVIYLGDSGTLHRTGHNGRIYSGSFRAELSRRFRLVYTPAQLIALLKDEGVPSLEAFIDKLVISLPPTKLKESSDIGKIGEWRRSCATSAVASNMASHVKSGEAISAFRPNHLHVRHHE